MQVGLLLQTIGSLLRTRPDPASAPSPPSRPVVPQSNRAELLAARRQLLRVLESLGEVDRLLNGRSVGSSGLPAARSVPPLPLNVASTAATLGSVEEINATPTSFAPFVPAWSGSSTASLSIDGVYDGSNGTGALSFEVRQAGVHGADRLRIRVRDPLDNIIRNVTILDSHPLDRQYDLGNGLFFTLGAGSLVRFETAEVQVFDSVGSVVDIDKPLDGTGNDNPNLEFAMPDVTDGSFQLNGVTIPVDASSSLADILNAIDQSAAGVTAAFDPATERLQLTQKTAGAAPTIDIQGDDSNFVQATKLDTATVVPGTDADTEQPLDSVTQFAGVQSGSFLINDTPIAVDAASDSLSTIIERINASGADVVADFDPVTKRFVVTGENRGEALTIDGNGTGIFDALNLPEGRVDPEGRGRGYSPSRAGQIADAIERSLEALNDFFVETKRLGEEDPEVARLRAQVRAALTSVPGLDDGIDSRLGIDLDLDRIGQRYIRFAFVDRGELIRGLRGRAADTREFLTGSSRQTGLLQAIGAAARGTVLSLDSSLGTRGTLFDGFA